MPNNSILGAGSIIGKQMKFENSIYLGNPVICIKQNIFWNK